MSTMKLGSAKLFIYITLAVTTAMCFFSTGCVPLVQYERTQQISATMQPGQSFYAKTHNGEISVTGSPDGSLCQLTAKITGKADTLENAQKVAESIDVKLQPSKDGLNVVIEKPFDLPTKYFSVALTATIPDHANLELITHNGQVDVLNITGDSKITTHNGQVLLTDVTGTTKAHTHNGTVIAQNIKGATTLDTHNGPVVCTEITGDMQVKTHNGAVTVIYSSSAPPVCSVSAVTHNGAVNFTAPPEFSAAVEASTHNGTVSSRLPITVVGEVSKKNMKGTIGTGQGKLYLETHNGSININ